MHTQFHHDRLSRIRAHAYSALCTLSVAFTILYILFLAYITISGVAYLLACLVSGAVPSVQSMLLIIGYSCWYYLDRKSPERGGYRTNWFITLLRTKLFLPSIHYFPITLHFPKDRKGDLREDESYIVGYHPHGALPIGAIVPFTGCTGMLRPFIPHSIEHIKIATVPFNITFPGWRELLIAGGFISSSFDSCHAFLQKKDGDKGKVLVIAVGGSREMLEGRNGRCNLILSSRKGIFRLALLTGSSLVPVFGFNENELFHFFEQGRWLRWLQEWSLERLNFTIPLIRGKHFGGLLPARREVSVVFGNVMRVERTREEDITEEMVEQLKEKYMDELRRLYEENVQAYGDPKVPLVIM